MTAKAPWSGRSSNSTAQTVIFTAMAVRSMQFIAPQSDVSHFKAARKVEAGHRRDEVCEFLYDRVRDMHVVLLAVHLQIDAV